MHHGIFHKIESFPRRNFTKNKSDNEEKCRMFFDTFLMNHKYDLFF